MKKVLKSIFCVKRIPVIIAFLMLAAVFVMICVMLFPGKRNVIDDPPPKSSENTPVVTPSPAVPEKNEVEEPPEVKAPTAEELYIPYSESYSAKRTSLPNALCSLDGDIAVALQRYDGENVHINKYVHGFPVSYIGSSFELPRNVKSLELPDSVVGILSCEGGKLSKKGAFYGNKTLEAFLPAENLKYIGEKAFYECTSLADVFLPITLAHIDDRAFYGCTSLTDIKIYGKVSVGEGAFAGCTSLSNVVLSENIRRVGLGAFDDTPFYDAMTDEFCIVGDILLKYNGTSENVVIPKGVRLIADGVFAGRLSIRSVTVPESVEYIGNSAFRSCARLSDVKILSKPVIGANAFDGCTDNAIRAVSELFVDAREKFYSEVNSRDLTADE